MECLASLSITREILGMAYPDGDGATFPGLLSSQGVRFSERRTPVPTTDGKDGEFGNDNGSTDGSRDFLGGLDAETDVTLRITDDDNGLEAGTLTSTGLLLDGFDLSVERWMLAADTQKMSFPDPGLSFKQTSLFCPKELQAPGSGVGGDRNLLS